MNLVIISRWMCKGCIFCNFITRLCCSQVLLRVLLTKTTLIWSFKWIHVWWANISHCQRIIIWAQVLYLHSACIPGCTNWHTLFLNIHISTCEITLNYSWIILSKVTCQHLVVHILIVSRRVLALFQLNYLKPYGCCIKTSFMPIYGHASPAKDMSIDLFQNDLSVAHIVPQAPTKRYLNLTEAPTWRVLCQY